MHAVRSLLSVLVLWNLLTNCSCLLAAPPEEDDEEFRPGLVAEYRAGDRAVTRIDPDVAFAWDEAAPDARVSAERFEGTWRGFLLVRQEAQHRLHAFVQGDVTVELDGRRVLHGSAKQPQWISGDEFDPAFGERPLVVTFRKTEKTAQLKLYWSSDVFGLEPIPAELLFHDPTSFNPNANGAGANAKPTPARPNSAHADGVAVKRSDESLALIERGRQQFAAFRCGRCHVREGDAIAPAAPSLKHVAAGMTAEQIAKRLAPAMNSPDATALDRRMPHFRLNEQQARHLAAFLVQQSEAVKLDEAKTIKPKTPKEGEAIVTSERRGELLLRSTGCLACHRIGELGNANDLPFAGPDLTHVQQRRSAAWLTTWLADPQRLNPDHRMPVFGLTDEERHLIVMALTGGQPGQNTSSIPFRSGSTDSATASGSKRIRPRTASGVPGNDKPDDSPKESPVDAGRRLFVEHRCAACHQTTDPKLNEVARAKTDLSRSTDWSSSCPDEQWVSDDARQPIYLRGLDRGAIKAFLASRWDRPLSPDSQFVRGQRLLEEKNCFACHPRHRGIGLGQTAKQVASLDKELNGQAPAMVAPSLNAIGDKLLDEALSIAVRGERQPIRMPWLKVRMPRFKHSPDELATLTRYFVEHDRIPSGYESVRVRESEGKTTPTPSHPQTLTPLNAVANKADAETHLAGQALTGVRGWSCIACHKIGDYEPKQVALGARGSDLKMLGKHIRPEFFFRWIASPLRVVPGVEMPNYNRPVAGVLDGNLSRQHAALWQALNDPNFQPPTNPANVEQLWVVNPGDRPRIIRDVFQLPKEFGSGNVARAFAVGFDNGHSLLFDAETASIRQWTFGDFARQQVVGKRWFWQMAGVDVARSLPTPQFVLRRKSAPKSPVRLATQGHVPMRGCWIDNQGVHVSYWLWFITEDDDDEAKTFASVVVDELLTPISVPLKAGSGSDAESRSGVQRRLSLRWLQIEGSTDFELWFGRPAKLDGIGLPKIEVTGHAIVEGNKRTKWKSASPGWQRLSVPDQADEAWEWTELPLKLSFSEPLPIGQASITYTADIQRQLLTVPARPMIASVAAPISSVPGFDGLQLPLDTSIMPTGFCWQPNGTLVFSSLKGHVFSASDSNGDGAEDRLRLLHEGLSAPYGVLALDETLVRQLCRNAADAKGILSNRALVVAARPDVSLLVDLDGDGHYERQEQLPVADQWGLTDDYHEWTTSPVLDSKSRLYWGLSSDYTDKNRPKNRSTYRGKILRLSLDWQKDFREGLRSLGPEPIGHAFRYPTGIAINERDEVFVSDQQGVQNCFNEINYLVEGAHYGVPSTHEEDKDAPETKAAIQIPHPWTRSVNGLCFLTGKEGYPDLKGHGIGCEYNGRFLIRFTTQRVGDVMQGAVYPFSLTDDELVRGRAAANERAGATNAIEVSGKPAAPRQTNVPNFEGPLCCGVSPKGEIFIGSISDSGWAGGQNTGSIVKLKGNGQRPNGIREIRATRDGFDIDFFAPVDRARATNAEHYSISGYTRVWGGAYATPDSDRHRCKVVSVELSEDGKTAKLKVEGRKSPNYVYDISCREVAAADKSLWPDYGFFTLHRIPNE